MLFQIAKLGVSLALISTLVNCQLISFKDGNVGVNFGGYHASAGLGGLLRGDLANGGLHAEAGTPHGQAASAGLGGHINDDGTSSGGLYAGATAGGGVSAGAGLGGTVTNTGSAGFLGSGATAGGASVTAIKSGVADGGVVHNIQTIPQKPEVIVEKQFYAAPILPKKTVYIEKSAPVVVNTQPIVQPDTYYVSKYYRRPHHHHRKHGYYAAAYAGANYNGNQEVVAVPQKVKVVQKTYSAPAPVVVEKYVTPAGGGFFTKLFANYGANTNQNGGTVNSGVNKQGSATYTANASINKSGEFFNDIFNIPISALTAVNKLVNNIVGNTSVQVSKTINTGGPAISASASAHGEVHKN